MRTPAPRVRLKYVCEGGGEYGLNIPASEYEDEGIRLIRTSDLAGGRLAAEDSAIFVRPEAVSSGDILQPGDLLLSRSGTVGRAFLAPTEAAGMAYAGFLVRFRTRSDVVPRFVYYCTQSAQFQSSVQAEAITSTIQNFNAERYNNLAIPMPPPGEQRAIADYLDRETARIDTLIEEQQRLIEMLHERRTAAIAAGLESLGDRTRLKHVSTVQTGVTLSGEGDPAAPEWPYLRVANVQVGYVDRQEIKTVRVPPDRAAASMLQPGDVLMTEGGDIDKLGRGALWRGEVSNMLHQNHIFAVRSSEALDAEFLVYWLDGPVARTYFRTTAKQTTNLAGTNKWTLGNLPVPVPPLDEQRRIAAYLDQQTTKIDKLIEETERFIGFARERRAALITAAVTGQIDVRELV